MCRRKDQVQRWQEHDNVLLPTISSGSVNTFNAKNLTGPKVPVKVAGDRGGPCCRCPSVKREDTHSGAAGNFGVIGRILAPEPLRSKSRRWCRAIRQSAAIFARGPTEVLGGDSPCCVANALTFRHCCCKVGSRGSHGGS